jgi:multidrug efflux pump subunit AcrA (membrane-fusion protein)
MKFFCSPLMMVCGMPSPDRSTPRWLNVALGVAAAILAVIAILALGPASHSATGESRIIKAQQGVVQSTVSASGNVELAHQLDLGFATAGVVSKVYVAAGQRVTPGQLLAELDPKSAEATLEQSRATLQAAEAALAQEEESGGETAAGGGAGTGAGSGAHQTASAASLGHPAIAAAAQASVAAAGPTREAKAQSPGSRRSSGSPAAARPTGSAHSQPSASSGSGSSPSGGGLGSGASPSNTSGSSQAGGQSEATKQANLASARAAVKSDRLTVENAEKALSDTKLYAPEGGTILELSGEVGEAVSAVGTTRSNAAATGSGSGSGASGAAGTGAAGRGASSSGSSSASSSPFAVVGDLGAMQLVVALSESEVVHVHPGQPATVTVEALEGRKLAAQVTNVAALSSSSNGVVSYQVTFQLEQLANGLRPGMSATAEVVVHQEEGVNVPSSAISAGSVTVVEHGKRVARRVVTGLAGDSSTIILSGLNAGEEVVLPLASAASAGAASRLGARGGGALGGGGGLFPGRGLGGGGGFRGGGG